MNYHKNILNYVKEPILNELEIFETKFSKALKNPVPLLDLISSYIVKTRGKRLRPILVFLSAKTCGQVNESTYTAAILIELLHNATLVHDDVIDDSDLRRNLPSIKAKWKNKVAVLVGDYLLSKSFLYSLDNHEYKLLEIISTTIKQMVEGELLQLDRTSSLSTTEELYFKIIERKTASLMASCCELGAASAHSKTDFRKIMASFGRNIGISYQLSDDLKDFDSKKIAGKPAGNDIKEQMITLPLIFALNNSPSWQKKRILQMVKNQGQHLNSIREIFDYVNNRGGIHYARRKITAYNQKACQILQKLPQSRAKKSMEALVDLLKS
jgi:octaprenyl-diphosphate synthase